MPLWLVYSECYELNDKVGKAKQISPELFCPKITKLKRICFFVEHFLLNKIYRHHKFIITVFSQSLSDKGKGMFKSICALFTGFGDMCHIMIMWHSPFLLVGYGPFVVLVFILDMKF